VIDVVEILVADTLAAIVQRRSPSVVLLGFTDVCAQVHGRLCVLGLDESIVAVLDQREDVVGSRLGRLQVQPIGKAKELPAADMVVVVCADRDKEELLRSYAASTDELPAIIIAGDAHFEFSDAIFAASTAKALVKSTATGSPYTLIHLFECLQTAARLGLQGAIAEFGMYKGGTTVMLARMASNLGLDSRVLGFDSFSGFPPRRSMFDMYADPVCEFTLLDDVRHYCEPYGIEIVVGDILETVERLADEPLILSFFDTDNYSPTRAALPVCIANTVIGGSIVFDHYHSLHEFRYTIGERLAAKELLPGDDFMHFHGTGVFTRLR
jgi:hypothetical protein